jgi:glycosyltransferase involved in cell wall biosynthesis
MNQTSVCHTFAVLAYKESPYLGDCLASLLGQTIPTKVVIATSTPSEFLREMARRFKVELFVNPKLEGIAADWTFGLEVSQTQYVTLAHQDDVYYPGYAKAVVGALRAEPEALIAFSDYVELKEGVRVDTNLNLMVKRLGLRTAFRGRQTIASSFDKLLCVRFGNLISCPAVTFDRRNLREFSFSRRHVFVVDWEAWVRLARRPGRFVYLPGRLMAHRIHSSSATTLSTDSRIRVDEEMNLFEQLWPWPLARLITFFYRYGHVSNSRQP